jgi:DNA-binding MarR family transcriptional regulator
VLSAVAGDEGASQTKLVETTGIDRSTLADIVRRLTRKRLLQRRRTREDARAYAVRLTDDGRRVLSIASPVLRRVDERILSAVPDRQREAFVAALVSIVDTLDTLATKTSRTR